MCPAEADENAAVWADGGEAGGGCTGGGRGAGCMAYLTRCC